MCRNCENNETTDQQPARIVGQATFGADFGLAPVVPVEPDAPEAGVCDECKARVEDEDKKTSEDGTDYCESCYDEKFISCEACSNETALEDSRKNSSGDYFCEECYCEHYTSCSDCGEELDINNGEEYYGPECEDGPFCQSCYNERYTCCAGRRCDATISINDSDTHEVSGRHYCPDCYNENFRTCDCCGEEVGCDDSYYCERFDADYCSDCYPGEECSNEECEDRGSCDCDAPTMSRGRRSQPASGSTRETYWQNAKFAPVENSTVRTGTTRTFAVEVETASCPGHRDFNGRFAFNCESDGSIDGEEFPSAVLHGDAGLDAITAFCDEANSKNWTVDSKCGAHVHFGARDLSADQLKSIAYAYSLTSKAWGSFVSQKRRDNDYCLPLDWGFSEIAEIETLDDFMAFADKCEDNRYQWLNLASYAKRKGGNGPRKTIEIRLHSGSLDSTKLCNWIIAHLRFIEGVMNMTMAEVERTFAGLDGYGQFRALSKVWDNAELSAYYSARAAKFGTNYTTSTRCSTRACKV